jgi:hypothetical protein
MYTQYKKAYILTYRTNNPEDMKRNTSEEAQFLTASLKGDLIS